MNIKVKKLRVNAVLPIKKYSSDAGYDLTASLVEDFDDKIKVYSGISIEPDYGYYVEFVPRSSIYKKNLLLINSIGIIDNTYRGEMVAFFYKLPNCTTFEVGERFGQIIIREQKYAVFTEVDELTLTKRASNGWGSSGK